MGRAERRRAVVLLAAFLVSVFFLWIHDHAGHADSGPVCTEAPGHLCTEEGHHRADPCVFCSLRAAGQELEGAEALALPFRPEAAGEAPERAPVPASFLVLPGPRGPPRG